MVRRSNIIIAIALGVSAVAVYALPIREGWLTNVSDYAAYVLSGIVVALLIAAGAFGYRAFEPAVIPDYVKRHRKELRERVFEPWVNAEIVASTNCGPNKIPFKSYGPILLRSSADVWWEDASRAYSHLRHRKYSEAKDSFFKAEKTMDEYNDKAYAMQSELEKQLDIVLSKFPEITEQGKGKGESKWWRNRLAILKSIEENSDFAQNGPDIYGGQVAVAYVEKKGIRDDFFRELRALKATHSPQFVEALRSAHLSASRDYDDFKRVIGMIIRNLDTFDILEGKCEVEEGKGL